VPPGTNGGKTLRLANLNAGVRSCKLELEKFLSEHGVDIYLLHETHIESGRAQGSRTMFATRRTARL
jgi:hypothetical protein